MYNGIGLTTPRGSGTNGHIQSNKFFVRPKSNLSSKDAGGHGAGSGLTRKPNKEILEHDRKRQMELRLVVLEDKLADQGYTDAEIAEKVAEARENLEKEAAVEASREEGEFAPLSVSEKKVSDTQTHQVAARKEKQMEALRAAFGMVPEVQIKKDEVRSISEEKGDEDEISDDGEDLNDGAKLHKKAPKNRNSDGTKAVKVDKTESPRDASELRGHKEQYKELGELTDSSDSEIHEKLTKRFPEQLQKYHVGSASESDSDEKSKKSLRENRKGKRHAVNYSDSDSDDEKYVKRNRKVHDRRSRQHDIDELESDGEKYERSSDRHDKRGKKHANDVSKSEEEKYKKHVKSHVKMGEDDTTGEKYREGHANRSRGHAREDSLSDHEYYERTSERGNKKSRRHDTGDFGYDKEKHEETSKRGDKEGQRRDYTDSRYNNVKHGKVLEMEQVSPTDRWNNKHNKDNKKYEGGNNFDIEETKKFTKGNGNTRRDRRHDTDDEDDVKKNIEKSRKSRKHDSDDDDSGIRKNSSEESDSSDDPKYYRRKKREIEKGGRLGGERSEQGRNEGKATVSSGTIERSKGKRVDDKEDTFRKLEDLSRSKRDATEDKSRVIMQGKRKSQDEQLEAKSRSRTIRIEVNDNYHKGFEENSRSFRNKDISDQKREDYLGAKKSEDKQVGRTYGGEEPQKEINRREREEQNDRENQRSDFDRKEERDHRERRRNDLDCKEERRYSRNDDEDSEIVRHRKDEEDSSRKNGKNEEVGQQGTSKRRGKEEEEERTRGRDEKDRHVDSSKRGKYDDYRSEKRKYDDDKRDDRGNIRSRRRD